MLDLAWSLVVVTVLAVPLAVTVAALLDAARRPAYAWALVGRDRAIWMAMILFGVVAVPLGLLISGIYLVRVRPELTAAEDGRF